MPLILKNPVLTVVAFAKREAGVYVGGLETTKSNPFGNGRKPVPMVFTPAVKVTLFGFSVVWSRFSLNPRWMKVETGTPVEPLAGPVISTSKVGAAVSILIVFVAVATGVVGGVLALHWIEPGYMFAVNVWSFTAPPAVCITIK